MANEGWRLEIRLELINIYGDNAESLAILLTFLDNQAAVDFWTTLRNMRERGLHQHVRAYTDNIIREERRRMNNNFPAIGFANDQGRGNAQGMQLRVDPNLATAIFQFMRSNEGAALGFGAGLAQVWDTLPRETQAKLIETIAEICGQRICGSHSLAVANNFSGMNAMYAVGISLVVVKCWVNVSLWYKGELSAKRCAKKCVDSIVEYGAGFLGALGGAALGAMFNPFAAAFMGALGGVVSAAAAKVLIDCLTSQIFDLKITTATENAYRFFELDHNATPEQIDVAYESRMIRNDGEPDHQRRQSVAMMLNINMTIVQRDQRNRFGNREIPMIAQD